MFVEIFKAVLMVYCAIAGAVYAVLAWQKGTSGEHCG